jgi:3-hydroxybutyrate dehydrogenase
MSELSGKWALVTGATAGLGLAIAESLAVAGASLVVHDLAAPQEAAESLKSRFGVEAIGVAADLSQRAEIETMMRQLLARLEAIDILVNNAVVRHFAPVEDFAPEHWDEALAVNLSSSIWARSIPRARWAIGSITSPPRPRSSG